jgi:hypothetical protein
MHKIPTQLATHSIAFQNGRQARSKVMPIWGRPTLAKEPRWFLRNINSPDLGLDKLLISMKDVMKTIFALLLLISLPTFGAHAALITVDSPVGTGTAVLDTASNKEWLKLSLTANLSFNEVAAALEPGGRFEGFRYPGYDELICELLEKNTGLGCNFKWTTYEVAPVDNFLNVFGGKVRDRIFHTRSTIIFTDITEQYIFGSAFYYYDEPEPEFEFDTHQVFLSESGSNELATHWLVRNIQYVPKPSEKLWDTQPAPEPSTIMLLGIGIFALTQWRQYRAKVS